jgi:putative membrane protein
MNKTKSIFFALSIGILIWSGVFPKDQLTWFLEVFPSFIGLPILIYLNKKYGVSTSLFIVFCLHSMILSVGGHYTYAEVPAGFWFQEYFHLSRNHYDRLGHFFQGVTPALIAYDYFKREKIVIAKIWIKFIPVAIALAFSALYEMFEWWTAISTGEAATAFLGTQGDVWDTQWDMFMALFGASFAMILLAFHRDKKNLLDQTLNNKEMKDRT